MSVGVRIAMVLAVALIFIILEGGIKNLLRYVREACLKALCSGSVRAGVIFISLADPVDTIHFVAALPLAIDFLLVVVILEQIGDVVTDRLNPFAHPVQFFIGDRIGGIGGLDLLLRSFDDPALRRGILLKIEFIADPVQITDFCQRR